MGRASNRKKAQRQAGPEPQPDAATQEAAADHPALPRDEQQDRQPGDAAVAPSGAGGTAGAGELQLEIVRMLLAAGATLADEDRNGVAAADRIRSQALREALAAGQL
jgi:hypothetical protein